MMLLTLKMFILSNLQIASSAARDHSIEKSGRLQSHFTRLPDRESTHEQKEGKYRNFQFQRHVHYGEPITCLLPTSGSSDKRRPGGTSETAQGEGNEGDQEVHGSVQAEAEAKFAVRTRVDATRESPEESHLPIHAPLDTRFVEEFMRKLSLYIENADDVTQLHRSLVHMHRELLAKMNGTENAASYDVRLSTVREKATYSILSF